MVPRALVRRFPLSLTHPFELFLALLAFSCSSSFMLRSDKLSVGSSHSRALVAALVAVFAKPAPGAELSSGCEHDQLCAHLRGASNTDHIVWHLKPFTPHRIYASHLLHHSTPHWTISHCVLNTIYTTYTHLSRNRTGFCYWHFS